MSQVCLFGFVKQAGVEFIYHPSWNGNPPVFSSQVLQLQAWTVTVTPPAFPKLYLSVCRVSVYMCGDQKRESDVLVYHSLPVLLRQGLCLSLRLTLSWIDWEQTSLRNFSVSVFHGAGVIGMCKMTGMLCGCWNLNSGPHDCRANVISFELPLQPSSLSIFKSEIFPGVGDMDQKLGALATLAKNQV